MKAQNEIVLTAALHNESLAAEATASLLWTMEDSGSTNEIRAQLDAAKERIKTIRGQIRKIYQEQT